MAVNTVLSTVAILIVLIVAFVLAWPDPEVLEVLVPTVATSLIGPLAFAPISRSLWTAMVVLVLPPEDPPLVDTRPI